MSRSPAFTAPVNSLPADNDPQIVKVPMDKFDFGFRPSQKPPIKSDGTMAIQHVRQGK